MAWQTGLQVGQYEIVSQLGSGGMATVYKAYHRHLDRFVAIKVMHANFQDDESFVARFNREAQIVARLQHPHIVPVYDFSNHETQPYFVMKYIEGETLKERLMRGLLSVEEIIHVMSAIASALDYAHDHDILHRDVKPSNIVIDKDGTPYLADFGLARLSTVGQSTMSADMVLGTPHYISPEQAKGLKDLDGRTDVYSFGVVLYELFVGRVPFSAENYYSIINDHINTPVPQPSLVNPEIPEAVSEVLIKAMGKKPSHRFSKASDAIDELKHAVAIGRLSSLSDDRGVLADISLAQIRQHQQESEDDESPTLSTPILNRNTPVIATTPSGMRTATIQAMPEPTSHKIWIYGGLGVFLSVCLISLFVILGTLDNFTQLTQIIANNPQDNFVVDIASTFDISDYEDFGVSLDSNDADIPLFEFDTIDLAEAISLQQENPDEVIPYLILAEAYWANGQTEAARTAVTDGFERNTAGMTKEIYVLSAANLADKHNDFVAEAGYLLTIASSTESNVILGPILQPFIGEKLYNLVPELEDQTLENIVDSILSTDSLTRPELRAIATSNFALLLLARSNVIDNNLVLAQQILNRVPNDTFVNAEKQLVTAELKIAQNELEEALEILTSLTEDRGIHPWIRTRAEEITKEIS